MNSDLKQDVIEQVERATDIKEVIEKYTRLQPDKKHLRGECPLHPDTGLSLAVNPERQIFYCYGCGEGGDVFEFVKHSEGLSFLEAVRYVAQRAGVPIGGEA